MVIMKQLTVAEVHAHKAAELGLDPTAVDLTKPEAFASALRRAASYLCPCSAATLVRAVVAPLRGIVPDLDAAKEFAESTLEALVAHGDVLEQPDLQGDGASARMLLYAAPGSFVIRQSGLVILLGVMGGQRSPLPSELARRIQYVEHVRRLSPLAGEDLRSELRQLGLIELTADTWLKPPRIGSAAQLVAASDFALDSVAPSREIPGLSLLDPTRPVSYYRGRWVELKSQSGCYVGRRVQAYGADLWCYVRLVNGQPERMIDLPRPGSTWRGCDEAWHLQMAIDAERGSRQHFRVSSGTGDSSVLEFFSPVPAWARRRWDAIGEPATIKGCLFAYRIARKELDEERRFARDALWLEETNTGSR
jgi:hypothetical protein